MTIENSLFDRTYFKQLFKHQVKKINSNITIYGEQLWDGVPFICFDNIKSVLCSNAYMLAHQVAQKFHSRIGHEQIEHFDNLTMRINKWK